MKTAIRASKLIQTEDNRLILGIDKAEMRTHFTWVKVDEDILLNGLSRLIIRLLQL